MKNKILYSIFPAISAYFLFLAGCTSNTPITPSNITFMNGVGFPY